MSDFTESKGLGKLVELSSPRARQELSSPRAQQISDSELSSKLIELFGIAHHVIDIDENAIICIGPLRNYYYLVNKLSFEISEIFYDIDSIDLCIDNYKLAKEFKLLILENLSNVTVCGIYYFIDRSNIDTEYAIEYKSNNCLCLFRQGILLLPIYTNVIDLINADVLQPYRIYNSKLINNDLL